MPHAEKEHAEARSGRRDSVEEELEKASPLDDIARRVFDIALREMNQLEQHALTSMHLLIGLCQTDVLSRVLHEKGLTTAEICEKAREWARRLIGKGQGPSGISENALAAIVLAAKRARVSGKEKIDGDDLLAALLERKQSKAVGILASFGITREEVLRPPPTPPTDPPFSEWRFEKATGEALRHGLRCAKQARLSFVGTPHLMVGLSRTGVRTMQLLRGMGADLEGLCDELLRCVGEGQTINGNGGSIRRLVLTDRCRAVLSRANVIAGESSRAEIAEVDLLRAILEENQGATAGILLRLVAPPPELLARLLRVE